MFRERGDYLFYDTHWFSVDKVKKQTLQSEIDAIPGNRILNTSVDDLCEYFEKKFWISVPELHEDDIVVDMEEVQIDISQDVTRHIRDRSRPFYVPGTLVKLTIPFSGESEVLKIQPTTCSKPPPRGEIQDSVLVIKVQGTDLKSQQVKDEINRQIGSIKNHLDWLRNNAHEFNNEIRQIAKEQINWRREKLLADQNLVESLGFPLKVRNNEELTYEAPIVRRRITPKMPSGSSKRYKPEPELSLDDYDHILSVITNMTMVMERSPSAFSTMSEEALRWHFLVQLNGHYEGKAMGETFNYKGKTDILIRAEGKNIFIAECKFWKGAKNFRKTIDQLLGYLSWRDTKSAILVFNRNKDILKVIESIPSAIMEHPNFKKCLDNDSEGRYRCVLAHDDDKNREMVLTVIVFNVPKSC